MSAKQTRDHIIDAADQLIYQQGYSHTSFANIATAVEISRGNFYHHFKSKDEILGAVIDQRLAKTQQMLDQWQTDGANPAARLRSFIHILNDNRADIKRYGCPVGTLNSELAKLGHAALPQTKALFGLFHTWLAMQFSQLGCPNPDALAMHLLARSQGVATLANAFGDDDFIQSEIAQMCDWLATCIKNAAPGAPNTALDAP